MIPYGTIYWLEVLDYYSLNPINTPLNKVLCVVANKNGTTKHGVESQLRRALDSAQVKIMKRFRLAGKVTTKMFLNLMLFEMR